MLEAGGCTVVDGGRSMNPSAQDILSGIRRAGAETVFLFPNHKNVFLAANQAKEMCDFCHVVVIPSEDIGHCYHAISLFDETLSAEELTRRFDAARELGKTVHVAEAIRPCEENGITVETGDWLCFDRDRILVADREQGDAVLRLFDGFPAPPDLVIVLIGEEQSREDAAALQSRLEARFPDTEFIPVDGGQPIYNYIFIIS